MKPERCKCDEFRPRKQIRIETEVALLSCARTAFGYKVQQAVWNDQENHWDLVIEKNGQTGQTIHDTCDV